MAPAVIKIGKKVYFIITVVKTECIVKTCIPALGITGCYVAVVSKLFVLLGFNIDDPCITCCIIFSRRVGHYLNLIQLTGGHIS